MFLYIVLSIKSMLGLLVPFHSIGETAGHNFLMFLETDRRFTEVLVIVSDYLVYRLYYLCEHINADNTNAACD